MLTPLNNSRYISIKADGHFHETVTQDIEGAVLREYELRDGTKGSKWELVYKKIEALITNIQFQEGDYGENLQITFKDEEENEVILSQGVGTSFGEDILKKLPSINFSEKVTFNPYAFDDDKGKLRQGVTVYQKSDKVLNYFWDEVKKKPTNNFPEPEGDTKDYTKDDWKIHFLKVRKFLVGYTKERIVPKFYKGEETVEYPQEELKPENISF